MTINGTPSRAISTAWACRSWRGAKRRDDTEQRNGRAVGTARFRARRKRGASADATQIGDSVPNRLRVELVEEWDEPDYVSVKCRDPDGYIVEAAWEPER